MNDASKVKRNAAHGEDIDNVEPPALEVAPPPPPLLSLERQTHHTPPGAFAVSVGSTPQQVSGSMQQRRGGGGGARCCRTNSCGTHATMPLEDEDNAVHHVPVAELVLSTSSSMVSSIGGSFTVATNNHPRLYDVEIAQEVHGGVIPGNARTNLVWKRALLLATVVTLFLIAVVGTTKAVRPSSPRTAPSLASNNNDLTNTTTAASQGDPSTVPIIPCPYEETILATHDNAIVCFVAKKVKKRLHIPLNATTSGKQVWEISCPEDGSTILVDDGGRQFVCQALLESHAELSEAAAIAADNDTDTSTFPWLQAVLKRSNDSP
jgi:hypothetical protein